MALSAILVNPQFLFRVEQDPPGLAPKAAYRVSDLDLASRLSFFLWSSLPDDALLASAAAGVLEGTIDVLRMRAMNAAVDRDGKSPATVAEEFLRR